MKQLCFGKRVVEVDTDATIEFYKNFTVSPADSQCIRNYIEYCKQLLPEEREFFDSLGIIPERCNVQTIGMDEKNNYPTSGSYFVIGRYLNKPKLPWVSEGTDENNFEYEYPNFSVSVGNYEFEFVHSDMPASEFPPDMPENSLCIRFFAETIPWLLKEKCNDKLWYPPKRWQLIKRLEQHSRNKKFDRVYKKELEDKLLKIFETRDIRYTKMSLKEIDSYMEQWFAHFVPDSEKTDAKPNCFGTDEWAGYLWHAFSYEFTPCKQEKQARDAYDDLDRGQCVLLMSNEKIGFSIENSERLSSGVFDEFMDIFITDKDFKWTYVHTHEEYCGPYFALKQS